eukprot:TRINITY_DN77223_c0_g1_i1.p3 TRINITY_DN77223_c0_g1~~TRINITY_DN77223_c0_g1_i1.p3  ORF type:complete len:148 (+),score=2.08 TRINITY_DN77223_c0_g1_i1:228-671(+)
MMRFAMTLSADQSMSLDAVQDVWLSSISSLKKLKDPRVFKSWMLRAVKWRVRDLQRKSKAQQQLADSVGDNEDIYTPESGDSYHDLAVLIRNLPDEEREVLYLFYQHELQLNEIAAVQEIPVGTVKSRLSRARNRLKTEMEKHDEYR